MGLFPVNHEARDVRIKMYEGRRGKSNATSDSIRDLVIETAVSVAVDQACLTDRGGMQDL